MSPLGQLATCFAAPRFGTANPVAGPPKRFAQAIGAIVTVGAVVFLALGHDAVTQALLGVIIVAAVLDESVFAYCIGCRVFAGLMRTRTHPGRDVRRLRQHHRAHPTPRSSAVALERTANAALLSNRLSDSPIAETTVDDFALRLPPLSASPPPPVSASPDPTTHPITDSDQAAPRRPGGGAVSAGAATIGTAALQAN